QRCLQKDANQRLRDIGDARLAIDELLGAMDPRGSTSGALPRPAVRKRRQELLIGAAAIVVAGAAGLWVRWQRPSGDAAPAPGRLIAILPFRDLSNATDGSLIGEGLVETVSARLGGSTGMQVVSPTAVVTAASADSDPGRVAKNLGATVYLRGSVQRNADRV